MRFRIVLVIVIATQALFCMTGCEQIKEYRMKAYYEKAHKLYEAQDYRAALREAQNALEFNPDFFDALALQGMCQYELERYVDAAKSLDHVLTFGGFQDELLIKAADAWIRGRRYGEARTLTARMLKRYPDNPHARFFNALARLRLRRLGATSGVDSVLQPLFADDTYKERAFALLAEFHILNDDLAQAESILTAHAHPNDEWLFSMAMLAERYDSQGDQKAAARIYLKGLEVKPDSTQFADLMLDMFRRSRLKDEELQLLKSLIAADEKQIRYQLRLIDFYIYCGRVAEAEQHIRTALQQHEGYFDFSRYLVAVYEKMSRYSDAILVAKDVLARVGDDSVLEIEFMNILARLYYMNDNPALAKVVVRWVLGLDRNNHAARFLLARIALDEGRTLLAIAELRGLGAEDTENPDYDYYMGLAHMVRAEYSNAEQSFKEALKKQPSYKLALLKIVEIYFEKGFLLDVERVVNEFLAVMPDDPDVLAVKAALANKLVSASEAR